MPRRVVPLKRSGHTLQTERDLIRTTRALPLDPGCPLDEDQLATYGERLRPVLERVSLQAFQQRRTPDFAKTG